MNPLAWILDSMKVHPEPVSIPDVSELTPVELAEIRSRLQTFSQVATELRKLVDQELAGALQGSALRYGNDVIRASNGKGSAKISDPELFWNLVAEVTAQRTVLDAGAILHALCPPNIRLTALPKLLHNSGYNVESIRDTFIVYDPPSTPLSVVPIQKAPKYLQDLEEGEIR